MFKRMTFATALVTACLATSLSAETFEITLVEGGFFPEITYVTAGDTVVFVNALEGSATTQAIDLTWTTGVLGVGNSYTMTVEQDTTLAFSYASDLEKAGLLTFEAVPLQSN